MPREKEQKAYTFSQTLRSQIRGLNIVAVRAARRPSLLPVRVAWMLMSSWSQSSTLLVSIIAVVVAILAPAVYFISSPWWSFGVFL